MPLSGQAKTAYQREYMRKRRSNKRSNKAKTGVRPTTPIIVRPEGDGFAYTKLREPTCAAVVCGCRGCRLMTYHPGKGLSCPAGEWSTSIEDVFEANVNPDGDCQQYEVQRTAQA